MNCEQQQETVVAAIEESLGYFVREYRPDNIAFPVLPATYALWRKYAYRRLQASPEYRQDPGRANFTFYLQSECHHLITYTEKVTARLEHRPASPLAPSPGGNEQPSQNIVEQYNRALELHSLYQQLLEQIVGLPYLGALFGTVRYQLKEEWCPQIVGDREGEQVSEKVSNSLVNKGFGIIAEKIFTKTFIFQASSLAIRLNPLCMLASFAFGELISKYRREKKGEELSLKVQQALLDTQRKAADLKAAYEECIGLLGPALREGGPSLEAFLARLRQLMVEDWLSVEKRHDDDGWEVVSLRESGEHMVG